MTRLQRARAIAGEDGLGGHECAPEYLCDVLCKEGISSAWDERHLIAASLVLDGYHAPRTRRKLPACMPVRA